jgi:Ca2+-binding EF-hand superfamily protein
VEVLQTAEKERRGNLNNNLRHILDQLRKAFASPANDFYNQLVAIKAHLGKEVGDLETSLSQLKNNLSDLQQLGKGLPAIQSTEAACDAANIEDNEFTDHTYDDLEFEYTQVVKNFQKKISFVESQIQAQKEAKGVSPEQLQEFKETFTHFDSQKRNQLSKLDFKSCLSGLGVVELDFEGGNAVFESIFKRVSAGADTISFNQFVDYMVSITADTVSPQQLKDSFDTIAGNKDHITVNDLKVAQLSAEQIQYLTSVIPRHSSIPDAYDYKSWLKSQFA